MFIFVVKKMDWFIIGCSCILMGIIAFWLYFWNKNKKEKKREENTPRIPKGNLGWPLVGETIDFIACGYTSQPVSFMEKRRSLYGKVFKTNILGTPIIVSTDADVNKVVLQNHGNIFVPAYPKSITELLGEHSILQTNGSFHKRVHALIGSFLRTPHFKARITSDIENSVKLSLARWKWNHMQLVYVQDEAQKIAFEVLTKVLMSVDPGEYLNSLKTDFEEFIKGLICLPIKLPGTRLYKSLKAKERLLKIVGRIVEERKWGMENNSGNSNKGPPNDVVDVLLQESSDSKETRRMPLDFITGNIIEMMIPGEETVPTAMTLAVKYLSDNPVVLQKLREENMELKKQKVIGSSTNCTWTDYMSLPFTQNVISETLRMANIINGVWRKALKDVEIKGYLIPKDWCVLASFISVHMAEENYENPYEFDPWRWETELATVYSNSFTPFGGGQRLCPGLELSRLELAIFLHHLVTNYRWIAEKDEIVHFPTVKMKRKLPITVTSIST
ncbi:3-epi-6-deoxocathasterone 23-monooxygenase isoform X2 [Morus notabilis]|uniref:3-epi-6-deoxocathasterone 23-monooxygenase isoform X2 n=1 Tax=Morus notabilis TaxID=981085 RepID=UPI000CECE97B|nr:3-epi-6-deoxocathasterone 23-monooxygenase isoform X2 [Morus notabilis]